jgi:hypothetical protein
MFQKHQETFTISEFLNRKEQKIQKKILEEKSHFFQKLHLKEVKAKGQMNLKKKYQSLLPKTTSVSLSVLVTTTPVFAQTPQTTIPSEVDSLFQTVQIICLGLVTAVATLSLMAAGALRIVGLGEKAKAWSMEILKGMIQVISAPVVVWLIVTILKGILSPLPGYQNF